MTHGTQHELIYQALLTGPKTTEDFAAAGINTTKLTARMAELRIKLSPRGMVIRNVRKGCWELIAPRN